jgi:CRP-like cAMP-binding protein
MNNDAPSLFSQLTAGEIGAIQALGSRQTYLPEDRIFSEGEPAEFIYFVERGLVSIFIEKFNSKEEIQTLGQGEYFGEMAVFYDINRTASARAVEETACILIARGDFMELMRNNAEMAAKIDRLLAARNEELVLKEKLIDLIGPHGRHLHIGIKGDPSLRESAMSRDRYESVVDRLMPQLVETLQELLLRRCVYRVFIGFNSGEIRLSTILDPFSEEFHPANRLVDRGYIDRHFPAIDYQRKAEIVRRNYQLLRGDSFFEELPPHLRKGFDRYYTAWSPMPPEEIARIVAQLPTLRSIPDYYVRNATISLIKDAIHMQFNCDGAHIVSAAGYERFLAENL